MGVAAGQGAAPWTLTLQQAFDRVQAATTLDEIMAILDRVDPPREWYKDEDGNLTEEFQRGTWGDFARAKDWIETGLDSDISAARIEGARRRRRRTRKTSKRKHFRKRTSRRH
jgi:hypothetical protein